MNKILKQNHRLISLGLIAISLVTFWQVRDCGFINLDDNIYIYDNPHIRQGLTWDGIRWAFCVGLLFDSPHADYWQPVTWLSRMVDIQFFGLNPSMHHLMNLAFHVLNTLLLFHVLRQMTTPGGWQAGSMEKSAWVAVLFAVHPLHVESVAWVTARKDMLSGFFWMLTIWAYLRYIGVGRGGVRNGGAEKEGGGDWGRRGLGAYALVVLMFTLGLMSKPMVVTLPFVLLLLDYWPLCRMTDDGKRTEDGRQKAEGSRQPSSQPSEPYPVSRIEHRAFLHRVFILVLEKCPLFVLSMVSSLLTYHAQGSRLDPPGAMTGLGNALVCYVNYLAKTIFPYHLAVHYPPSSLGFPMERLIGSALVMGLISFWVVRRRQQQPYLLIGWLWFVGTLVPVMELSGLINGADRFTYLPLVGIFILVVWGAGELCPSSLVPSPRLFTLRIVAGMVLVAFMVVSAMQLRHWRNSVTLFEHAISVTTNNPLAHNNLAVALLETGQIDGAIRHFERALQLKPSDSGAYTNFGVGLAKKGRVDDAIRYFLEAIRVKPSNAEAENNLGTALISKRKPDEAVKHYNLAIQIRPDFARAHHNLGNVLAQQNKLDEAVQQQTEALRIKPDYAEAHYELGSCLIRLGKLEEAMKHFEIASALQPTLEITPDLIRDLARQGKAGNK